MHAPLSLCLFVACSAALSERQPEIRWVKCSQHVPTGTGELYLTGVDLGALPSTLHCGRIDVPMDYSRLMCEQNKITLGLAMYRPVKPKGVLFYNPGGTDPAAVVAWQQALEQIDTFDGLLDYDLMSGFTCCRIAETTLIQHGVQ